MIARLAVDCPRPAAAPCGMAEQDTRRAVPTGGYFAHPSADIEQPCDSYEECLAIRRRTDHPFVLDESIDGMGSLLRGHADAGMDVVNIKISKFGGLTKARQARDLCVSLGVAMTIEDTWGGDIVTAAISHLAHSTPPELLFTSTDFNSYVTVSIADGAPQRYLGTYAFGAGPTERFEVITNSGGRLAIRRGATPPRGLFHVGEHTFHPSGARFVRIRFAVPADGGDAQTLTVHDADLVVPARRVS